MANESNNISRFPPDTGRPGKEVENDPQEIFLVQGLSGCPKSTWTCNHIWPKELFPQPLPAASPRPRILVYGYNSDVHVFGSNKGRQSLVEERARDLVSGLDNNSRSKNEDGKGSRKPNFVVCHSVGGIISSNLLSTTSSRKSSLAGNWPSDGDEDDYKQLYSPSSDHQTPQIEMVPTSNFPFCENRLASLYEKRIPPVLTHRSEQAHRIWKIISQCFQSCSRGSISHPNWKFGMLALPAAIVMSATFLWIKHNMNLRESSHTIATIENFIKSIIPYTIRDSLSTPDIYPNGALFHIFMSATATFTLATSLWLVDWKIQRAKRIVMLAVGLLSMVLWIGTDIYADEMILLIIPLFIGLGILVFGSMGRKDGTKKGGVEKEELLLDV